MKDWSKRIAEIDVNLGKWNKELGLIDKGIRVMNIRKKKLAMLISKAQKYKNAKL